MVRSALIVGAGNLGESTLRMVDRRFLGTDYDVVGFLDDDPRKAGSDIHGVPVLGLISQVPELLRKHRADTVIFAISAPRPGLLQEVLDACGGMEVRFNVVSVLRDVQTGELSIDRMRKLRVEDLLGRTPVSLDPAPVHRSVSGARVMVTGAGGSIGSELCRQLASMNPSCLVLFDCGETPLFEIDRELRQRYPELDIQPMIGDVKHEDVVNGAFKEHKPEVVYHAAAYKHVPLMEAHPDQAVLNNVHGTRILAEAAKRHRCRRFVMISTDKAVRPTNVMGATKRLCELVVQSMNDDTEGSTVFTAVRFGNVLGSNGSVIPIFRKQLEEGCPLTVTHPDMTRYFMMIPEAVSLVLQCGVIADPGDVFVLDMGTPVKIIDLARSMIRLSGLRENIDASIKVTGLRPGEKMFEELVAYGEELKPTAVPKVNVLKEQCTRLAREVLMATIARLEESALARHPEKTRKMLWRLIDLDLERTQLGVEGLGQQGAASMQQAWLDSESELPQEELAPSRGRVLVVTRQGMHESVARVIRVAGYEPDLMTEPDEAFRLLASDPGYAALLCDYVSDRMPVWNVKDHLKRVNLDIRVLAMSAYDHARLSALLEIDEDIPVLPKPFTPQQFQQACSTQPA